MATVDMWVDFIHREGPYNLDPNALKPFWSSRLESHNFGSAELDFSELRLRWDRFIMPMELEHFDLKVRFVWEVIWRFF